ncbi:ATP-dependent RNA helicase HrpB [Candidatus Terasakiella magnetica]|uniref:ATP-dependent RNA helicase HrpB n=1 Tax=Candidatus Terasakiella magnetica TaxID=1867952 RepID=A0A1C3RLM6_9PROT|nr:ATP-dependent helicase HrpB [Candidatus Terasakiella magnetica]SCA58185.1 ATP-dependent RNA helicase HrpB [Candidatus Terasakiella magnetica]
MTTSPLKLGYPVEETFPELKNALSQNNCAILEAPPGAGKTTLVPLALLNEPWLGNQKIIMLEPRRLAARMAATRMASLLGEEVGQSVGYRIRQDKKISAKTRIEVVTEGILTRQIQDDPELDGIGLVIFDEFHERNLQGDLGLAFCLETMAALRDDLRLLVMSATLDGASLSSFLDDAPCITSQGKSFEVETKNLPRPDKFSLAQDVAKAVNKAVREESGNILVFLPGEGEIRKTEQLLKDQYGSDPSILIAPLYGALSQAQQDLAISPTVQGKSKIVLATTIAETSLTIEGIRVVIDCGLKRVSRFDAAKAMSKLETVRVSKASATQRKGRAGRMEAGVCYQLWPKAETQALQERDIPEILECDLTPFALDLASWGVKRPDELKLLDLPNQSQLEKAQELLITLGALDKNLILSEHGKEMQKLSLHPRIAHMVLKAREEGQGEAALACEIAATLHDGPLFKGRRECDIRNALSLFQSKKQDRNLAKGAFYRAKETVKILKKRLKLKDAKPASILEAGRILALAYPDRLAKLRAKGKGDYHLSAGIGANLSEDDPLFGEDYLVVAHMGGTQAQGRIFTAAPITLQDIETDFAHQIIEEEEIGWDKRTQAATAQRVRRIGALKLKTTPIKNIAPERLSEALCAGIRQLGIHVLSWDKDSQNLCQRVEFLRYNDTSWPDMSETGLLDSLEDWLSPFLNGCCRIDHLKKVDLQAALLSKMSWEDQQKLNQQAPTHYRVPSGSNIRLDYSNSKKPVLSVKLQEMFGEPQSPTINNGQCNLQIHLLSPAGRPLQVTEDLESFWQNGYDSVKKEMKGRYPKHPWPDNPIAAIATGKTKRKMH